MSQIMLQHYPQSQELPPSNCVECSHTFKHDPSPFLLAAHHIVKRPVSAHLSRTVRSSSVRVEEEEEKEGDDDRSYHYYHSSYPSPKPRPHNLISFSSAGSLPSPVPSESSILSSSSSSSSSPSPSQVETWPTSLSSDGQVRLSLEGVSPSPRSGKANLQSHQIYAANIYTPRQQQPLQFQQQGQQRQQETDFGGKISGDYDDTPSQGSPSRGMVYTYTSDEILGDRRTPPPGSKQDTMWILVSSSHTHHSTIQKTSFSPPLFLSCKKDKIKKLLKIKTFN